MNDIYGYQLPQAETIEADDIIIISGPTEGSRKKGANAVHFNDKSLIPDTPNTRDIGSDAKPFKDLFLGGDISNHKTSSVLYANKAVIIPEDKSSITLDLSTGNIFAHTLTQNCDLRFIDLMIGRWTVIITQDATGGHTVTFGSGIAVSGTIGLNANQVDILEVVCDGATCYVHVINDFKQ